MIFKILNVFDFATLYPISEKVTLPNNFFLKILFGLLFAPNSINL